MNDNCWFCIWMTYDFTKTVDFLIYVIHYGAQIYHHYRLADFFLFYKVSLSLR